MGNADHKQIEEFKKKYCRSTKSRLLINNDFDVKVESFERLLPGKIMKSYATGSREISGAFVVFRVYDKENDIIFYPVFSESVGGQLVRAWKLPLPKKMTIFTESGTYTGGESRNNISAKQRKHDNQQMLNLIRFARSMMISHVDEPRPMREPFKGIYERLDNNPGYTVFEVDIKRVNSAIRTYLETPKNMDNERFETLHDYIWLVKKNYQDNHLISYDFDKLREKMKNKYPDEKIVF